MKFNSVPNIRPRKPNTVLNKSKWPFTLRIKAAPDCITIDAVSAITKQSAPTGYDGCANRFEEIQISKQLLDKAMHACRLKLYPRRKCLKLDFVFILRGNAVAGEIDIEGKRTRLNYHASN